MRVKYCYPDSTICIASVSDVLFKDKKACIFISNNKEKGLKVDEKAYLDIGLKDYAAASKIMKIFEVGGLVDFTSDDIFNECEYINLCFMGYSKSLMKE